MKTNIPKGKKGEILAVNYLIQQGFKIVDKNWRFSRLGEIDIIAQDNDILVFIEVKARTSSDFGHPLESVSLQKLNRIRKLAEIYISQNVSNEYNGFRLDMIGILLGKSPEISHLKDI